MQTLNVFASQTEFCIFEYYQLDLYTKKCHEIVFPRMDSIDCKTFLTNVYLECKYNLSILNISFTYSASQQELKKDTSLLLIDIWYSALSTLMLKGAFVWTTSSRIPETPRRDFSQAGAILRSTCQLGAISKCSWRRMKPRIIWLCTLQNTLIHILSANNICQLRTCLFNASCVLRNIWRSSYTPNSNKCYSNTFRNIERFSCVAHYVCDQDVNVCTSITSLDFVLFMIRIYVHISGETVTLVIRLK